MHSWFVAGLGIILGSALGSIALLLGATQGQVSIFATVLLASSSITTVAVLVFLDIRYLMLHERLVLLQKISFGLTFGAFFAAFVSKAITTISIAFEINQLLAAIFVLAFLIFYLVAALFFIYPGIRQRRTNSQQY